MNHGSPPTPTRTPGWVRAPASTAASACGALKTLQLSALLGHAQGIDIEHNGHVYRLQITKAGKLILTK